jgi:hypothetical protein
MTQIYNTPELGQNTIVISNARRDEMAGAMSDAQRMIEMTLRRQSWEPYVETPAQKLANARAARIASLIESL